MMALKLPAYAKRLIALREQGLAPLRRVCVTRTWPRRKPAAHDWTLIVPGDEDPEQYDYSIVTGLGCLCYAFGSNNNNAVFFSLIEAAEPRVAMFYVDGAFQRWIPS